MRTYLVGLFKKLFQKTWKKKNVFYVLVPFQVAQTKIEKQKKTISNATKLLRVYWLPVLEINIRADARSLVLNLIVCNQLSFEMKPKDMPLKRMKCVLYASDHLYMTSTVEFTKFGTKFHVPETTWVPDSRVTVLLYSVAACGWGSWIFTFLLVSVFLL